MLLSINPPRNGEVAVRRTDGGAESPPRPRSLRLITHGPSTTDCVGGPPPRSGADRKSHLPHAQFSMIMAMPCPPPMQLVRSEARRVGTDLVSTGRSRWSPYQ